MIRSMTGFGSAASEDGGVACVLELRSVNNRYYKAQVRLPDELSGLEAPLDSALSHRLARGSVTVTVRYAEHSADAAQAVNGDALDRYVETLRNALERNAAGDARLNVDVAGILALPGVLIDDTGTARVERLRAPLLELLDQACDALIAMREHEGRALADDLLKHIDVIQSNLSVIDEHAPQVVDHYQKRLRTRMETLLAEAGASVREEDLLREVAVFAERSDISEEISRLAAHLVQFREILDGDGTRPVGRTLDFLAQEMLREANTIGSKCLDPNVSRHNVEIKGAIDRVKEQVQNVE